MYVLYKGERMSKAKLCALLSAIKGDTGSQKSAYSNRLERVQVKDAADVQLVAGDVLHNSRIYGGASTLFRGDDAAFLFENEEEPGQFSWHIGKVVNIYKSDDADSKTMISVPVFYTDVEKHGSLVILLAWYEKRQDTPGQAAAEWAANGRHFRLVPSAPMSYVQVENVIAKVYLLIERGNDEGTTFFALKEDAESALYAACKEHASQAEEIARAKESALRGSKKRHRGAAATEGGSNANAANPIAANRDIYTKTYAARLRDADEPITAYSKK